MAWMEKLMMQVALVDKVTGPLRQIENTLGGVGKSVQQSWGQMAGGAGAMISGALGIQATLQPAIEMDRALGEVASLGVTDKVLNQLGITALKFGMDYGKSATDLVRASYQIQSAMANLEGYELSTFTKASGVLAAATKADTATITDYLGTMYGIFEQQANAIGRSKWVEDLAGKTATAVQIFKTTGKGMADAFEAIGAAGNIAGVSMDEQFAVLGMLQSTMGGGEAGTKFNAFLSGIGNAQKVLGMNFQNSAGLVMPILDILDQLKVRYGDTLTIAQSDELKKAFGSDEAVAMIKLLMTNTNALGKNINALANTHGMGKAEQMAASMTDQWMRLEGVWFALRASAFGKLTPAINDVISHVVDAGGVLLRWTNIFPNLTKVVSATALAFAGFAVLGGAVTIVSALGGAIAAIAWPVMLVGSAIGALVMWWDPIKAFAQGLLSTLGPAVSAVFQPWAEILPVIGSGISSVISTIAGFFGATNEAAGAFSNMTEMGMSAGTVLGSIFKVLYSPIWAIGKAIKWVLEMFDKLPGVNLDVGSIPDLSMPMVENINAPLTRYRQGGQNSIPSGGLGQQLIQATVAATASNQKPPKAMHIGEVHNHFQNPMTPEQMAENAWLETP